MARTRIRKKDARGSALTGAPAVILVDPQMGENIGMVARAMLNFGLSDLRLVRPRDRWPSAMAINAAAGADVVLEGTTSSAATSSALARASSTVRRGLSSPATRTRSSPGSFFS